MTFVDRGAIGLDDDISTWLPEFAGSHPPITARQLLDHTSGVHDNPCQNDGTALATCVRDARGVARRVPRGHARSPTATRRSSWSAGSSRCSAAPTSPPSCTTALTGPLGMDDTTWPGAPSAPNPAFGVQTHGRRLREVPRHDPARRDGERDPRAVRRRGRRDRREPGAAPTTPRTTTRSASRGSRATASGAGPTSDESGTTDGRERQRRQGPLPVGRLHDRARGASSACRTSAARSSRCPPRRSSRSPRARRIAS